MTPTQLKKDTLGLWSVVFFVVAAASPITGVIGAMPIAFMSGNGAGLPGVYVLAGLLLWIFSFGFVAMSRHVVNAGAFYSYVAVGLGPRLGMAGLNVALLTYTAIQISVIAMFGFFLQMFLADNFGVSIPWWACSIAMQFLVLLLGILKVELGGMVLGLLMLAEVGIILAVDAGVLMHHASAGNAWTWSSFEPSVALSGAVGIAMVFAISSFIGFEATAIYSEECRDPKRTIPRATFVSVTLITLFFGLTSWCFVQFHGADGVAAAAAKDPGNFVFNIASQALGPKALLLMSVLLITSLFAAAQAFHNTMSRYMFAISRDGFLMKSFSKVHPTYRTPYVASIAQAFGMVCIVAIVALLRQDPMAVVFSWCSALATMGILLLQATVSVAVAAFFRRNPRADASVWSRLIAPVIAAVGMCAALTMVVKNLNVLSGSESSAIYALPWVLAAAAGWGWLYAIRLARTQPSRFARLQGVFDHTA
ncbi:APC family permease [Variovorax boronicumulans]|uniref:APC family permease n=1 Tax=Variovorax boronicumulans TaxID=436515 RepID=UPI003397B55E